jgi:hypothetical protein
VATFSASDPPLPGAVMYPYVILGAVQDLATLAGGGRAAAMASQVVAYQLDDSTVVRFEIDAPPGFQPASGASVVGKVQEAIAPAIETAQLILERIKDLSPDAVEVKFGLKVSGKVDWLVAKAASEGNFEIKLAWTPGSDQGSTERAQPETP